MKFEKNKFDAEGYSGPFRFLNEDNCKKLLEEQYIPRRNFTWQKAIHEKSKNVLSVASNPIILEKIQDILGLNILLWGSNFVKLKAGDKLFAMDKASGFFVLKIKLSR